MLGEAQSGSRSHLRLLSLLKDADVIEEARAAAEELLAGDPTRSAHPELAAAIAALVAEFFEKG